MKFQKILVATDFSPPSEAALTCATALARDSGGTLLIVHVEEPPTPYGGGELYLSWPAPPNPEIHRMLEAVVPGDKSVRCEHRHLVGSAAADIVSLAREEGVDLIVVGTHGRTGLAHLLMGSVAENIVRKAACPVIAIKQPPAEK